MFRTKNDSSLNIFDKNVPKKMSVYVVSNTSNSNLSIFDQKIFFELKYFRTKMSPKNVGHSPSWSIIQAWQEQFFNDRSQTLWKIYFCISKKFFLLKVQFAYHIISHMMYNIVISLGNSNQMKTISGLSYSYKVLLGKLFGTWVMWSN